MERSALSWKEMIGPQTTFLAFECDDKKEVDSQWDSLKEISVHDYMKLYPAFLHLKNLFLVAHDTYLSIYMLNEEKWAHIDMKEEIADLTANYFPIDKDNEELTEVTIVFGSGKLATISFDGDKVEVESYLEERVSKP